MTAGTERHGLDGVRALPCHHARDLDDVIQVVRHPRGQQLPQRDAPEVAVQAGPREIRRRQVQRLEPAQAFGAHGREGVRAGRRETCPASLECAKRSNGGNGEVSPWASMCSARVSQSVRSVGVNQVPDRRRRGLGSVRPFRAGRPRIRQGRATAWPRRPACAPAPVPRVRRSKSMAVTSLPPLRCARRRAPPRDGGGTPCLRRRRAPCIRAPRAACGVSPRASACRISVRIRRPARPAALEVRMRATRR